MLVEDNQNLRKVLKEYLETLKFNVSDFSDGNAAAESFERHRYDICVFDIVMQGKSGFELLAEIRKVDEQVPVVFLTARTDKEDRIKAFKMGCDDYITKPFVTEELILRIEAILRRTRQHAKVKPVYKVTNEVYHFREIHLRSRQSGAFAPAENAHPHPQRGRADASAVREHEPFGAT